MQTICSFAYQCKGFQESLNFSPVYIGLMCQKGEGILGNLRDPVCFNITKYIMTALETDSSSTQVEKVDSSFAHQASKPQRYHATRGTCVS